MSRGDSAIYDIWLSLATGMRTSAKAALVRAFGDSCGVYEAGSDALDALCSDLPYARAGLMDKGLGEAKKISENAAREGIRILGISDESYPDDLRNIADPPIVLYYKGNRELLKNACIAVVGNRRASPYGLWAASAIGKKLAECGVCVVSGMAEGVDMAAQLGCLERGGKSIAVLGTGVDVCFPVAARNLYKSLLSSGLVVSEFVPGTRARGFHFPMRNRIISGLSGGVIVVQGNVKSGSMITAKMALEQGREVYAVPGNIDSSGSTGVNELIFDGATPIVSMERLPEILGLPGVEKNFQTRIPEGADLAIIELVAEKGSLHVDEVCSALSLNPQEVAERLTMLEIQGFVARSAGKIALAK